MENQILVLLGLPGSGKGTQAKLLREKFNFEYMGSGDLLRSRKKVDDFTGNKIASVIDNGGRVPTVVITKIWMEEFEKFHQKGFSGLIVDGSPRTIMEKELIEGALGWYGWENKKVILVDISSEESVARLTKRRNCKDCGKLIPYVGEFKLLEKCPDCGGELISRADDDEKGVRSRLEWFKTDVQPVIDYYEKSGELIRINGEQSIESVFKDVLEQIK